MMSLTKLSLLGLLVAASVNAFTPLNTVCKSSTALHAYVPDGLNPEQWKKIKAEESRANKGKNLGKVGPRGFKSRSMQAWQEAYERGEASHAFAPLNYRQRLQNGELRLNDIPYMVRGGSWDNSDVRGAKKAKWTKTDKEYARGGYKKEQSASILGSGPGFDWTGTRSRAENVQKVIPGFS